MSHLCSLAPLLLIASAAAWAVEPAAADTFHADTRGFGVVDVTLRVFGPVDARRSSTAFSATDAEHARICASKCLTDLTGFGDLKPVVNSGLPDRRLVGRIQR